MLSVFRNATALVVAAMAFFSSAENPNVTSLDTSEMTTVQGGSNCVDCAYSQLACLTPSDDCVKSGTVWIKITGTMLTPAWCYDPHTLTPPRAGGTVCSTSNPQDCKKYQTCTAAGCPNGNCGAASTTKMDSVCVVGGNFCPPPSD